MLNLNSARHRVETPHTTQPTKEQISAPLKRRAQAVINNKAIDAETRAKIRYCLETDDPSLAELVRRVDAGEMVVDTADLQIPETIDEDFSQEKNEALAEIICQAGDEAAAALLVLMAVVENAAHPQAVANLTKHFAFTRCGELNMYGMVDAQITVLETELLRDLRLS